MAEDEVLASHLEALLTPTITSQQAFYRQLGLRDRILNLPLMVAGNIRIPILNIYAEQDHLVPPASSLALEKYIASVDYTVRSFPVGHIGMYVSSKVQQNLPPTLVDWLKART